MIHQQKALQYPSTMDYHSSLTYLYSLQKYGIKFGLKTITKLLSVLGDPHKQLQCVHIAGTNGKGSTAACIASILTEAGYKTGLYTSPHMNSFTERIKINRRDISRRSVVRLTGIIRDCTAGFKSITFFEFVTAMAFSYFAEQNVDCAIIETGMGGRLDATNVVHPLVSIITNISREHELFLGNTILQIAHEKAGIIKRNGVLLTAARQPAVISLFRQRCRQLKTAMFVLGRDFAVVTQKNESLSYSGMRGGILSVRLGLRGTHQIDNCGLALAAVEVLCEKGFSVQKQSVRRGLKNVVWPGRLETVKTQPLIVFDGAHNPAALRCLKHSLLNEFQYKRLTLVLGIMGDKDIRSMLREIVPIAHRVILCRPHMERAAPTAVIAGMLGHRSVCYDEIQNVGDAFLHALTHSGRDDLICVTGSLFTVGEAREALHRCSKVSSKRSCTFDTDATQEK